MMLESVLLCNVSTLFPGIRFWVAPRSAAAGRVRIHLTQDPLDRDQIDLPLSDLTHISSHMSSASRKPAPRLARPAARYWKGKAPKGADGVPSDSDEEEEIQQPGEEGDVLIGDQDFGEGEDEDEDEAPIRAAAKLTTAKSINVALKDVNISKDGKVIVAGREESGRTELEGTDTFYWDVHCACYVLC